MLTRSGGSKWPRGRTTQGQENSKSSWEGSSSGDGGMRQAEQGTGLVEPEKGRNTTKWVHHLPYGCFLNTYGVLDAQVIVPHSCESPPVAPFRIQNKSTLLIKTYVI